MDLRQLRTFVTVAEQGTVSRASQRLHVAQPALSRQITGLELQLGVKLFDRIRRRLVLTSAGQRLLADCRAILGAVDALSEQAQLLQQPDAGILKVGATPQTIDGVLSDFLPRYAQRRPRVQVKLHEGFGAALMAMLERGEVHVVISTGGAQAGHHSLETIWLPPLKFVACFGPTLELAGDGTMDIRKLGSHPLLLLDTSFAVRMAFDAACRVAEFKPNVFFESRTPHTLLSLAESGLGVAIVPSVLPTYRYDVRSVHLTYGRKPLREPYGIMWDRRRSLPPYAMDFCQTLAVHMRNAPPVARPASPTPGSGAKKAVRRRSARGFGGAASAPGPGRVKTFPPPKKTARNQGRSTSTRP